MKNTDIAKIRQILTEIHDTALPCIHTSYSGNFQEFSKKIEQARWNCSEKIRQALVLLSCETCGGSGRLAKYNQVGDLVVGDPCPDCQKPECPVCKERRSCGVGEKCPGCT